MSVFVVCCQLEVSATDHGSPNECVCCQLEVCATVHGSPNECFLFVVS